MKNLIFLFSILTFLTASFSFSGCSATEEIVEQKPQLNYYQKREKSLYQQFNAKKALEDLDEQIEKE
jgi:uncharacterized lipoprotein YajG